jgi:hypothetical protein
MCAKGTHIGTPSAAGHRHRLRSRTHPRCHRRLLLGFQSTVARCTHSLGHHRGHSHRRRVPLDLLSAWKRAPRPATLARDHLRMGRHPSCCQNWCGCLESGAAAAEEDQEGRCRMQSRDDDRSSRLGALRAQSLGDPGLPSVDRSHDHG